MNIMQRRGWRICGWAALVLTVAVVAIEIGLAVDPHAPRALGPVGNTLSDAAALCACIAIFAPHVARLKQNIEVTNRNQQHFLALLQHEAAGERALYLVQPPADAASPETVWHEPPPFRQHARRRRTGTRGPI